ncbi:MAG: EFR1 family ferrodoxin [Spirochaetaceae bacterium]|jgi:ferredoxin|nr:EFR1 family ferrodoxin [Spirochaetaceae bacterium]
MERLQKQPELPCLKIYYFSGTGNTLWSAKKIAWYLNNAKIMAGFEENSDPAATKPIPAELFNISALMRQPPVPIEADRVIFMFPSYAYQMPLIARRFIIRSEIRSPYIAALVTYGSDPGGTLAELRRLLKLKNLSLSFSGRIPSVENYIPIFGPPGETAKEKRLLLQERATEKAAKAIVAGKTNSPWKIRPLSIFVSSLFRLGLRKNIFVKGFRLGVECNGCGLCARLCPGRAIIMEKGKPVFSEGCEQCQACLNWCPRQSISFLRLRSGTKRYRHPGIKVEELLPDLC